MKSAIFLLLFISTGFASQYSVKYDAGYSFVVELSGGQMKSLYLAENKKGGLFRIPQTVRIDGSKFTILCDLYSKTSVGATVIALRNIKGEVTVTKDGKPKIGKYFGALIK